MSIATESISRSSIHAIKAIESDARNIAKEHGVKIRRHRHSGIDVTFADGRKLNYFGWNQLRNDLVDAFHLAD